MPKVHNEYQTELCTVMPDLMLEAVVEDEQFAGMPSAVDDKKRNTL